MADRWIITTHKFMQHESLEKAQAELARLQELHPKKRFQLIRTKTTVERSNAQELNAELQATITELLAAFNDEALDDADDDLHAKALDRAANASIAVQAVIAKANGSKAEAFLDRIDEDPRSVDCTRDRPFLSAVTAEAARTR